MKSGCSFKIDGRWLGIPDFLGVFVDGAIATELGRTQSVEDRHSGPQLLVVVGFVHLSEIQKVLFAGQRCMARSPRIPSTGRC